MLFADHLVVVRGGGDLATGVVTRLHAAGFPVIVTELPEPLAIRRTVSFAAAVTQQAITIDGVSGALARSVDDALALARAGMVGVVVTPGLPDVGASVVVDARLAKRLLDTSRSDAPFVVALGPGFTAPDDCHAIVETMRGHRLGRVIWAGAAAADTGRPGELGGATADRVVRAPAAGIVAWDVAIADMVTAGDRLGAVGDIEVHAPIAGVVRGLIAPGHRADEGLKIADIDPRADAAACFEVSDKARLVGAGVLEAVLVWLGRR
jgi:xanthine dehydrogenase accessory factor